MRKFLIGFALWSVAAISLAASTSELHKERKESLIRAVASGNWSVSQAVTDGKDLDLDEAFIRRLTNPVTVDALHQQWKQNVANGLLGDAETSRKLYAIVDGGE